ncbi:amidohydrolase [Thioclava sp. ES.031]|uniref:amidohydrolase n=1 Tax=Thioclava sp. ES.031 TaxID=1798203 RepID=UPI000BF45553|nr:amidohydrolase [Thioclava sp. ES.031]PFG62560.1 amidohydrolase [Thioclava sp. ES.031]
MTSAPSSLPPDSLTNSDIAEFTAWRHRLHQDPELSGEERDTAARVVAMLLPTAPDRTLTELGGHGVAAIYEGAEPGPTVLLRCELDALPIHETGTPPYRSNFPGKGHLCGHDGHMAILAGVARWLSRNRPARGRAILLFQPAEETGAGAAAVIADPRFAEIAPDLSFALHNMPGVPFGAAALQDGVMNCASRGMKITLTGWTAHASLPESGRSPAPALARLLSDLTALGNELHQSDPDFARVTITHARLGEPAFGVAPGAAELWATLRTQRDAGMAGLVEKAEAMVREAADALGLEREITYHDVFRHCENAPEANAILRAALRAEGIETTETDLPMRASEDFGRFADHGPAAMALLGAGDRPALHNPDYDFPDALIGPGARVLIQCLRARLY